MCTKFSNFLGGKAAEKEDVDQSLFIALDQKEPCVYVCARLRSFHTFQFQKDRKRNEPFFPYYSKAKKKMAKKKISAIAKEKSDFPFSKLHRKDFFLKKKSFDVGGKSAYIFLTFLMYLTV